MDRTERLLYVLMFVSSLFTAYSLGEYNNDIYMIDATDNRLSCVDIDRPMEKSRIVVLKGQKQEI